MFNFFPYFPLELAGRVAALESEIKKWKLEVALAHRVTVPRDGDGF